MITKTPLRPDRLRRICGSFAFIEHRFLRQGFLEALSHHELILYLFLVLAADHHGLSYYAYDRICASLNLSLEDYIQARDALIHRDLIAFDGRLYQVLSLPPKAHSAAGQDQDPAFIRQAIQESLGRR